MDELTQQFREKLNSELSGAGITGIDKQNVMSNLKETENETDKKMKPKDYLKDGASLSDVLTIAKDEKLTKATIKKQIESKLKNPSHFNDFIKSITPTKKENTEATGTGGSSGAFEPLFSTKKETKEATSTSSSGQYDAPSFQNVKMKGNTPKGKGRSWKKTQIPGGNFVQVKDKCKKFPYCNQGDIKALNIFENETLKRVIDRVSENYGIHKDIIKDIILTEVRKNKK
jgi:hypothetical protein